MLRSGEARSSRCSSSHRDVQGVLAQPSRKQGGAVAICEPYIGFLELGGAEAYIAATRIKADIVGASRSAVFPAGGRQIFCRDGLDRLVWHDLLRQLVREHYAVDFVLLTPKQCRIDSANPSIPGKPIRTDLPDGADVEATSMHCRVTVTICLLKGALNRYTVKAKFTEEVSNRRLRVPEDQSDCAKWADHYLLPDSGLACTSFDLYSSRCGIVHSMTAEPRTIRRGDAKRIFFAWGDRGVEDLQRIADQIGQAGCAAHVDTLDQGFQTAVNRFMKHLNSTTSWGAVLASV